MEAVATKARTSEARDGKMFALPVDSVVHVKVGEKDEEAFKRERET